MTVLYLRAAQSVWKQIYVVELLFKQTVSEVRQYLDNAGEGVFPRSKFLKSTFTHHYQHGTLLNSPYSNICSDQYHQRLHSWEEAEILVTNSEGEFVSHDVHHFAELRPALNT